MPNRSCFRTPLGGNCVNGSQTLLKSARQHFHCKFPSIWDRLCSKTSLLVRSEILGLFVETFTADYKYSLYKREKFQHPVHKYVNITYVNISEIIDAEERGYLDV